jgi:glycosyltransferase involved in cell wall biosynthesis
MANSITNYLSEYPDVDVYYFGITAYEESLVKRYIHPRIRLMNVLKNSPSKDPYGEDLIVDVIRDCDPDIVMLYNDILVISRILNQIDTIDKFTRKFKVYTYIDLVYKFENSDIILSIDKSTDRFFVFSECWIKNMVDIGVMESKIYVLRHCLDTKNIYRVDVKTARKILGVHDEDFIILNINRNTHRKAIDITISSFLRLLKRHNCDSRIKLYLSSHKTEVSYDILEILKVECFLLKLDYQKIIYEHVLISTAPFMTDEIVNYLYNACDVGINTCYGEGFGLCNLEHASVGKPQVMSKVGALVDIFNQGHCKLVEPRNRIYTPPVMDRVGGYLEICHPEDFADALEYYYLNKEKRLEDGEFYRNKIMKEYNWNNVMKEFYDNHIKID